ncbi:hypothetical protein ACEWY4_006828 [Coilia grayii]|uniref:Insulin-like 3 n=1 Tax=Coilia grayii TaxID=363190 RepID=A0ABD1KF47_9TELE
MIAKLFAPLLVCLLIGDNMAKAQDGRIKLCGREFVRMVISSCGSSRLRRHAPELDKPHRHFYSSLLDRISSDRFLGSGSGEGQQEQERTSEHEEHELSAAASKPDAPTGGQGAWPRGAGEGEVYSMSRRIRRDAGPAGLCCRSGCTISELVQFC